MATNKKKADLKAKKARKQKTILAVVGVLFVVVLAIQAPRILKMVHGGGETTAAPYVAFPNAVVETAAPVAIANSGKMVLPDRDLAPQASEGQLVDFELFSSKDPFVQQVKVPDGSESAGTGAGRAKDPEPNGGDSQAPPEQEQAQGGQGEPAAAPTAAVISVNGAEDSVQVGGKFPTADPAFVLVSASQTSVRIGIAGGSLATGDKTVTLRRGKTLTLVNTVDGTEYHLRLVSLS